MSAAPVIIRAEQDGSLSFGDFRAKEKLKANDFEHEGSVYSVRTHHAVTRVEKNGKLLIESVPGAAFSRFSETASAVAFGAEGAEDAKLTLELEPNAEYAVFVDGVDEGRSKANMAGKISFGLELGDGKRAVRVERVIAPQSTN